MNNITDEQINEIVLNRFKVDTDYIDIILKQLEDWRVEDITLTEQFNTWFIQWLAEWANQIEKYFSDNVPKQIEDFAEFDPTTTIEDIVITDKVSDTT